MSTYLITAKGIGEQTGRNMLSQLAAQLPHAEHIDIDWLAAYGPANPQRSATGPDFGSSLADLDRKLTATVERLVLADPNARIVMAAYSGGAAGVGDWLAARWSMYPVVKAAVLVADPFQPLGVAANGSYGLGHVDGGTGREITEFGPLRWVWDERDKICCCEDDSPLRPLALASERMSLGDPVAWATETLPALQSAKIRTNLMKQLGIPWWNLAAWTKFPRAISDVCNYLGRDLSGRPIFCTHTDAYAVQRDSQGRTRLHVAGEWLRSVA